MAPWRGTLHTTVLRKIKSGVLCVSDQGSDPAGPAGSTGADESAQITDVANDQTVAVDGSAPSNGVRTESGNVLDDVSIVLGRRLVV